VGFDYYGDNAMNDIDIAFLGLVFDKEEEQDLLKLSKTGLQGAANTYQWALICGIEAIMEKTIDIISCLPVGPFPRYYKQLFLHTKKSYRNKSIYLQLGTINVPVLKQQCRRDKVYKILNKMLEQREKPLYLIVYSLYEPYITALIRLKRKYNNKIIICPVITDLPLQYGVAPLKKMDRIAYKMIGKKTLKIASAFDCYVLLTEQMKIPLKIGNKPYVVIEGIANEKNSINRCILSKRQNIILYSGTLHYQFGLTELLEAFTGIANSDYRLWICGSGEAEDEIRKLSQLDNRIKYLGYVAKDELYQIQRQATILINPRQNNGEYTKYSFPSKTMEYMLSGVPVLMYKLEGVPKEYYEHVYYLEDDSIETLRNKIVEICGKSQLELYEFGKKAQEFILREKASKKQAWRIIEMMLGMEKE
jgi:glycosyltransferase involved in cell wall biosynthesis